MKQHLSKIIILLTILALIVIFPLNLIRKTASISGKLDGSNYQSTAPISTSQGFEQNFIAQTCYIDSIDVRFSIITDIPTAVVNCQLINTKEQVVWEGSHSVSDSYSNIAISKWIMKGNEYTLRILPQDSDTVTIMYTTIAEHAPVGSTTLYCNGEKIDGQSINIYNYGYPLNIKNTICLYCFVLTIGFSLLHLTRYESALSRKIASKIDILFERFSLPLLICCAIGVLSLIVRICFNEAVHWDESYTWNLITKTSLSEMIITTAEDIHPPLYYLIVRAFIHVFGQNIFVAKMASLTATAFSMIAIITLVRKRWGYKVALPSIIILGLGTQFSYFNVDVRMYSWMIFFVLLSALSAYEIICDNKIIFWLIFILSSLGGVYTQYFAVVPLFLIYLYLGIAMWFIHRKQFHRWLIGCIATVIGYLPWLSVVINIWSRESASADTKDNLEFSIQKLCEWAFENNIVYSSAMPFILFVVGIILLYLNRTRFTRWQQSFLAFIALLLPATILLCHSVSSLLGHFWTDRYIVDALVFLWLTLFVAFANSGFLSWLFFMVWLTIYALSSYTVTKATELNTVPWINHAKEVFAIVADETQIVYTYPTFDIYYQYYLPNAEFIWYEDVDFATWPDNDFYLISWGSNWFSSEDLDLYNIRGEKLHSVRLEQGATADLFHITFEKP